MTEQTTLEKTDLQLAKERLFSMMNKMRYKRASWQDYIVYESEEKGLLKLKLWTDNFTYTLTLLVKEQDSLRCHAVCRKIKPGEKLPKSNDLFSGRFTEETLSQIMFDIASYELINIKKKYRQSTGYKEAKANVSPVEVKPESTQTTEAQTDSQREAEDEEEESEDVDQN